MPTLPVLYVNKIKGTLITKEEVKLFLFTDYINLERETGGKERRRAGRRKGSREGRKESKKNGKEKNSLRTN